MKKLNTSPISGMQELLPADQASFNQAKSKISEMYHSHGFQNIETPVIDRTEILLAKAGGETEKQIYKVVKTAESADDADQALRFDHTVPLARYVVEHESALTFPFKVSQIGRNFRGERAQKGRYREFYQCDIDIIGRNSLPIACDAEIIATLAEALKSFIRPEIQVRISNRKILSGLLQALDLAPKSAVIFSIIDHAEKVSPEKTASAFTEESLTEFQIEKLLNFINIRGKKSEVLDSLRTLEIENETFEEGIKELETVLTLLENYDLGAETFIADMVIVRGLDYYTGTVFETIVPDYREIGSICSGGRYENLASHYTDQSFPGVGGSIGLTRLFSVLNEYGLLKISASEKVDVALVPISENEYAKAFQLASIIRTYENSADLVLLDKRLGDKLTYASKIAENIVVIGENEASSGEYKIKNFETGEERPLDGYLQETLARKYQMPRIA